MQWSEYQQGIFDWVKRGNGHGAGIAVAGAGKTVVAVESMKHIPFHKDVCFTTFTKLIADTLAHKVKTLVNATVGTYNSLGFRLCMDQVTPRPIHNEDKTIDVLFRVLGKPEEVSDDGKRFNRSKGIIKKLVSLLKGEDCRTTEAAMEKYQRVLAQHDIDTPQGDWFQGLLFDTYAASLADRKMIDFDDQKLFPLMLGMNIQPFDFIIIDEYQDTCPVEVALMEAHGGPNTRYLVIGDPDQSIYSFRGAMPDQLERYVKDKKAKELPLSVCYRCSRAAVAEAKKIVPRIEAWSGAQEGEVDSISKVTYRGMLKGGDFVLCRTTAPAVDYCLTEIENGKKAFVKGKEFGVGLAEVINQVGGKPTQDITEFLGVLDAYCEKMLDHYHRIRQAAKASALEDKATSIRRLTVDCDTVADLDRRIKIVFQDGGEGIQFMTQHKSKGLEAGPNNDVFIIRPDLNPHPKGDPAEEQRLMYVARTRTKRGLYYVTPDKGER